MQSPLNPCVNLLLRQLARACLGEQIRSVRPGSQFFSNEMPTPLEHREYGADFFVCGLLEVPLECPPPTGILQEAQPTGVASKQVRQRLIEHSLIDLHPPLAVLEDNPLRRTHRLHGVERRSELINPHLFPLSQLEHTCEDTRLQLHDFPLFHSSG